MSSTPRRHSLLTRVAVKGVGSLAALDAVLFGIAGRWDWVAPWLITGIFAVLLTTGAWWFLRRDPELIEERLTVAADVPSWDRRLVRTYSLLLPVLFVTAALDAGRFRWSHVPAPLEVAGAAGTIAAVVIIWWCTASNHFLSTYARIQTDRGHRVVRHGPYGFVRHPMYTSIIVLMIGLALLLGSWLALIPAGLIAVLFIVRTSLEDRMLADSLEGYRDYARQVPARLLPGVW